jgi:dephospho-CoA kinase
MKEGTAVFKEIVEHFGTRVLGEDGEISRPLLGEIIFKQPAERENLNRLVHPAVRTALQQWISARRRMNEDAAVLVPLLFESGMQDMDWDAVVCVSSSKEDVFRRLEQRGLTRDEAEQRVRSQMPAEEKEKLADRVVLNSGTLGELEMAVRKSVESMIKK